MLNLYMNNQMKKIFYSIFAAALLLTGCNTDVFINDGTGQMKLDLSCSEEYNSVGTKAGSYEDIINKFNVKIERPVDGWLKTFDQFGTINGTVIALGSGTYKITASSPEKEDAAYDQPIFLGSEEFTIKTGQVTNVSLVCKVSNVKVSINLSENFVSELSDYSIIINNGTGFLTWEKNADKNDFTPSVVEGKTVYTSIKSGYFSVAPLTIQVNGHRSIDNSSTSRVYYVQTVAAADHHILNLDANVTGSLGNINITVVDTVNDIESSYVVPGFDEIPVPGDEPQDPGTEDPGTEEPGTDPEPSTAPTLVWDANPTFAPMAINSSMNADLVVNAPEKIAQFKVKVDSPNLTAAIQGLTTGGSDTMDLIGDQKLIGKLAKMAPTLPTGDKLLGQTKVDFFLTSLVQMISMYGPEAGTQHHFILMVTDEKGQEMNKKVTFVS